MSLQVSSTCAHHQEVKIALYSLWYHHTYRWLTTEIKKKVIKDSINHNFAIGTVFYALGFTRA